MHIGMIGGIGPAATEFYYHNLVKSYKSANELLELTIVHAEASDLIGNIVSDSPDKQAEIFFKLALRLQAAGAEVIALSSIAGHFCIPEFERISPLPIINVISALESELARRKLQRVGILGHRISMETKLFGGISSAEIVVPLGQEFDVVHDEYIKMATTGKVDPRQRELLFTIGKGLCEKQGAEAVILAGTDLFLAFDGHDSGFTVIDSALVHIDALLGMSVQTITNKVMHATSA
ncbi:Aspartate racemase [Moritella sp. JT01]|uniref:aspartate/glutamate racemase family protein n=1 Tax=Moritella sp. JT01 TaxID=756698 RepID=UPI0007929015|nr:aspartate/glutamate racemase family protein [Moritella sp. JT01]KXO10882.1 Aspartate racemase [Moritella sp. JT01]